MRQGDSRIHRALPPQRVARPQKGEKWQHNCVDSIIDMASATNSQGRTSKQNKEANYDIVNSRFKESEFDYVLKPYGMTGDYGDAPSKMSGYNIIRSKIESLKGEEMKMGQNFRAVAVNGDAVGQKRIEFNERVKQAVLDRINQQMGTTPQVDENGKEIPLPDPRQVAESFRTEYTNPIESANNKLLKMLFHQENLKMKFSQGWEHALVSAEEIYYAGIHRGHPSMRVCNPVNVEFDKEADSPFIQDAAWVREERWMPVGSVIDQYGEYLKDADVLRLDEGQVGANVSSGGMQNGFMYDFDGGQRVTPVHNVGQNTSHVYVATVCWQSYRKVGYMKYLDQRTGNWEETIVDESFNLTPEMKQVGGTIEWQWELEIWEGSRIGNDIYCNIRPLENQINKLPYMGYIYNNVNSVATSIVDLVKPHQFTYMIVWYRLENELAKAKGKKFVMDIAQLPKSRGWTVDQWLYYFDNLGVAWINSMEEGREGDPNSISKFNQFTSIDMSLSQVVGQYMEVLDKLEKQVESITGVSPQREGDIGKSETASGAQRAIIQSTNVTKPLFFYHDLVKKSVYEYLLEMCKVAYVDGADIEFALDESTTETIKFSAGLLNGTDMGIYITDSTEEYEQIEKLEAAMSMAIQQDKAKLSDWVAVISSKSISTIRDTIVGSEQEKLERDQQNLQADRESQEKVNAQNIEAAEKVATREDNNKELDRINKIDVALIGAEKGEEEDNSLSMSLKEAADIQLKSSDQSNKLLIENKKLAHMDNDAKAKNKLKEKELQIKGKDVKLKAQRPSTSK